MSSSLGSGESRRRAEIEAKRAKLAELKRAREERTSRLLTSTSTPSSTTPGVGVGGGSGTPSRPGSRAAGPRASSSLGSAFIGGADVPGTPGAGTGSTSRKDLDDFVATLVSSSGPGSSTGGEGTSSLLGRTGGRPSLALGALGLRSPGAGGVSGMASPRKSYVNTNTATAASSSEYGEESEAGPSTSYGTTLVSRAAGAGPGPGADGIAANGETISPRAPAEMVEAEQELFELPQRERVYYTKEVQTTMASAGTGTGDDDDDDMLGSAGGVGAEIRIGPDGKLVGLTAAQERKVRESILAEQEREREAQRLAREEEELAKDIEAEIKTYTREELEAIYRSAEFSQFLQEHAKGSARAFLTDADYARDYTKVGLAQSGGERADAAAAQRGQVRCVRAFWDEKLLKNRSVTAIDWSTQHPERCVSSYNRNPMAVDEPDGLVAVWNMDVKERPEFVLHAQTDVLSVSLSPFHPNLVIGGTYSGQILLWDTRARALPVLKTPLSASGHTHPVYSMQLVGTQNAHNLVSASTDGTVCTWMLDMLAAPQELVELHNAHHARTPEVSVTALSFPGQETNTFWVGTEEGNIYSAGRFDRAGSRAGLNPNELYAGHAAPVTGLHFHPLAGPVDFSDLFLSSSMDWTTRLWRANTRSATSRPAGSASAASSSAAAASGLGRSGAAGGGAGAAGAAMHATSPLVNFEEATDYIYDVKWHPSHPAVFGQVDGAGYFDLYNLNSDTERPIVRTQVGKGRALNKLAWDRKDGRFAAVGGLDGRLYIHDVGELATPPDDAWTRMQETVARLIAPASSSAAAAAAARASETDCGVAGPLR